ncbi:MAG: BolA family transcriptional regulator [Methylibium sp.]|uniref:BolA family protein n=1 Tax=Methylibium sp. TaxID=2067992 RepID=UPI001800703A|nr:BolA family protein [Methylibium sp.]MBA2722357.1 BolA family transcriptional regulator [Methylibium sp.]MBA3589354.1 BolA family transcriptional regulator [Methylibium sp.]
MSDVPHGTCAPASSPPDFAPSAAEVEAAIRGALSPLMLEVHDDSHLHAGHAGAREGRHFRVHVVSGRFENLSRPARHRLVYDAVALWMPRGIHALALTTLSPAEAAGPGA